MGPDMLYDLLGEVSPVTDPLVSSGAMHKKRWTRAEDVAISARFLAGDFSCGRSRTALADRALSVFYWLDDRCLDLEGPLGRASLVAGSVFGWNDRRFVEPKWRKAMSEDVARWAFGIPVPPQVATATMAQASPEAFRCAGLAAYWRAGQAGIDERFLSGGV